MPVSALGVVAAIHTTASAAARSRAAMGRRRPPRPSPPHLSAWWLRGQQQAGWSSVWGLCLRAGRGRASEYEAVQKAAQAPWLTCAVLGPRPCVLSCSWESLGSSLPYVRPLPALTAPLPRVNLSLAARAGLDRKRSKRREGRSKRDSLFLGRGMGAAICRCRHLQCDQSSLSESDAQHCRVHPQCVPRHRQCRLS